MNESFKVFRRNPGHWDIYTKDAMGREGRAFRIRGGPGKYLAMDERDRPYPVTEFKTITACMSFITDDLMHELIVAEGQEATKIEAFNVRD